MFKHEEIRLALEAQIAEMSPGELLPQERELAQAFDVSRATVRQALQALLAAGQILSVRGRGTFVADASVSIGQRLSSFSDDMRARGLEPSARLLAATELRPPAAIQRALGLDDDSEVFQVRRLRLANGEPMCIETVYLPRTMFPHLLEADLGGSLYEAMSTSHLAVTSADQRVTAELLTDADAELLQIPSPAASLVVKRVGRDADGVAIEYAESQYRPDRYDVRISGTR